MNVWMLSRTVGALLTVAAGLWLLSQYCYSLHYHFGINKLAVRTGKWACLPVTSTHRLLIVLEGLARLLEGADLLAALPLDVALLHLLQERVGPAQPPQHRVRRVRRQEHWETDGGKACRKLRV